MHEHHDDELLRIRSGDNDDKTKFIGMEKLWKIFAYLQSAKIWLYSHTNIQCWNFQYPMGTIGQ